MVAVEVDDKAVNKMVADAILNSALGERLREIVKEQLDTLRNSYNNPIKAAVERQINLVVTSIVENEFRGNIEQVVREQLTPEITAEVARKAWASLINRF